MSGKWPFVINLANSIIGVSVLTMPFCFNKCGIILGTLSLCLCAYLTKKSCGLLLKAAHIARSRTYELLALHTYGPGGKIAVELCIIGLLIGTCVAFFVIIGDLAPEIVHSLTGIQLSWGLRTFLLLFAGCGILLLGFMRNIQSLSGMSAISLMFYGVFATYILINSLPHMVSGDVWSQVHLWKTDGLLQCLPIFSLSFACQTQLFVLYDAMPEPSLKKMEDVINTGVNLVTCIYCAVGLFGYLTFYDVGIKGDILTNFAHGFISEALKMGFVLSVIISFPLMIFPCRASINSFITYYQGGMDSAPSIGYIPPRRFFLITIAIVVGTLIVGILIPNVEFVLGLNGATMGSMIAYILPAVFFLYVVTENKESRLIAKVVLVIGLVCFVSSTYIVVSSQHKSIDVHPPGIDPIQPAVGGVDTLPKDPTSIHSNIDSDVAKVGQMLTNNPVQDDVKILQNVNLTKNEAGENIRRELVLPVVNNEVGGEANVQPKESQAAADSDSRGPVVAPVEHLVVDDNKEKQNQGNVEGHHGGIARDIKSIIEETPEVSQAEIDQEIAKLEVKKAEINDEILKLEDQKVESDSEVVLPVSNTKPNSTEEKKAEEQLLVQNKLESDERNDNDAKAAEIEKVKKAEDVNKNVESHDTADVHHVVKRDDEHAGQAVVHEETSLQTTPKPNTNQYQSSNNKSRDLKSNQQDHVDKEVAYKPLSQQTRSLAAVKKPAKLITNPFLRYKKKISSSLHKKVSVR